jgi:hypothetical protein
VRLLPLYVFMVRAGKTLSSVPNKRRLLLCECVLLPRTLRADFHAMDGKCWFLKLCESCVCYFVPCTPVVSTSTANKAHIMGVMLVEYPIHA